MHWKPALEQHGCGVVMPHESRWCCGLSDEVLEFYFYWLEKERWPPSLATMIAAAGVAKKLGEEFCVKLTREQRVWTKSHTPTQSIKNTDWQQHLKTNPFCIFSFRFVERTRHNSFSVCAFSTVSMWSSIRTVQNLGDDLSEGGINRTCHGKKLEMSREIKSVLHDVTDHLQLLTFNTDLIISHLSLSISNTHTCCITFAHMHSFSLVGLSGTHVYVNTHTHTQETLGDKDYHHLCSALSHLLFAASVPSNEQQDLIQCVNAWMRAEETTSTSMKTDSMDSICAVILSQSRYCKSERNCITNIWRTVCRLIW